MKLFGFELTCRRLPPPAAPAPVAIAAEPVYVQILFPPRIPDEPRRGDLRYELRFPRIDTETHELAAREYLDGWQSSVFCDLFFLASTVDAVLSRLDIEIVSQTRKSYAQLRRLSFTKLSVMPAATLHRLPHLCNHVLSEGRLTHPSLDEPT